SSWRPGGARGRRRRTTARTASASPAEAAAPAAARRLAGFTGRRGAGRGRARRKFPASPPLGLRKLRPRTRPAARPLRGSLRDPLRRQRRLSPDLAPPLVAAASPASLVAARLGRVHPTVLEVPERQDDLRAR